MSNEKSVQLSILSFEIQLSRQTFPSFNIEKNPISSLHQHMKFHAACRMVNSARLPINIVGICRTTSQTIIYLRYILFGTRQLRILLVDNTILNSSQISTILDNVCQITRKNRFLEINLFHIKNNFLLTIESLYAVLFLFCKFSLSVLSVL